MPRFISPVEFFNDDLGRVIPGAQLFFFENKTTTPKQTFADLELTLPNPQPLISDGAGRFSDIWLEAGGYTVELRDENGELEWRKDDVNVESLSLISSTVIAFETHNTLKSGLTVGGEIITFSLGQTLGTQGYNSAGDGGNAVYLVVDDSAGTPDDILFLDIGSGLLAQRFDLKQQNFENVTNIKTGLWLGVGDLARTLGEVNANDGGGALYETVPGGTGTADNLNLINLNNGNQARLLKFLEILQRYSEVINTQESASGAITVNLTLAPVHDLTLTADVTDISFTGLNPASGISHTVTVKISQDDTGGWVVNWPVSILWSGSAPVVTDTALATDVYIFTTLDGGTTWYGAIAGQDFS